MGGATQPSGKPVQLPSGWYPVTLECSCGDWHELTPTAMAVVILAFQNGDIQEVRKNGVQPICMAGAFSPENVNLIQTRYQGRTITFNRQEVSALTGT